jgi:WD40 repeat protein
MRHCSIAIFISMSILSSLSSTATNAINTITIEMTDSSSITQLVLSPNSSKFAVADFATGIVTVGDTMTGKKIDTLKGKWHYFIWHVDDMANSIVIEDLNEVKRWDLKTKKIIWSQSFPNAISKPLHAISYKDYFILKTESKNWIVLNISNGSLIPLPLDLTDLFISADGEKAITPSGQLFNIKTFVESRMWSQKKFLNAPLLRIDFAAFIPQTDFIVTCSNTNSAEIWDGNNLTMKEILAGCNAIKSASVSSDGMWIVTSGLDNSAKMLNLKERKKDMTLMHEGCVESSFFSFDNSLLATIYEQKRIKIWDVKNGELLAKLINDKPIKFARFVSCEYIITESNHEIKVWTLIPQRLTHDEVMNLTKKLGHRYLDGENNTNSSKKVEHSNTFSDWISRTLDAVTKKTSQQPTNGQDSFIIKEDKTAAVYKTIFELLLCSHRKNMPEDLQKLIVLFIFSIEIPNLTISLQ